MVSATTGGKKKELIRDTREFDDLLSVMASVSFFGKPREKNTTEKKVKSHAMCERTRTSKKKKKKKKKKTTQKRKY